MESLLNSQQNSIKHYPPCPKYAAAQPRKSVALKLCHCRRHCSVCKDGFQWL